MELRAHPLMSHRSRPNWPPVWTQVTKEETKTLRGEVGVLKYVHPNTKLSNKCFLVVEYTNEKYVGCLIFDDKPFCAQVTALLQRNIGRPIKDIGDLDLSETL
jgi:hypothetical protein